ncbi:unnamed protein product [Acanthosepion pharaonis]|uniref:Uncharacterized protein n=1 Tax=Acanthosepion pharaonis TaxID=158019 RepID=A0A812CH60_ACAPH|nr:unnamed protein product [Sepia pharaonis]
MLSFSLFSFTSYLCLYNKHASNFRFLLLFFLTIFSLLVSLFLVIFCVLSPFLVISEFSLSFSSCLQSLSLFFTSCVQSLSLSFSSCLQSLSLSLSRHVCNLSFVVFAISLLSFSRFLQSLSLSFSSCLQSLSLSFSSCLQSLSLSFSSCLQSLSLSLCLQSLSLSFSSCLQSLSLSRFLVVFAISLSLSLSRRVCNLSLSLFLVVVAISLSFSSFLHSLSLFLSLPCTFYLSQFIFYLSFSLSPPPLLALPFSLLLSPRFALPFFAPIYYNICLISLLYYSSIHLSLSLSLSFYRSLCCQPFYISPRISYTDFSFLFLLAAFPENICHFLFITPVCLNHVLILCPISFSFFQILILIYFLDCLSFSFTFSYLTLLFYIILLSYVYSLLSVLSVSQFLISFCFFPFSFSLSLFVRPFSLCLSVSLSLSLLVCLLSLSLCLSVLASCLFGRPLSLSFFHFHSLTFVLPLCLFLSFCCHFLSVSHFAFSLFLSVKCRFLSLPSLLPLLPPPFSAFIPFSLNRCLMMYFLSSSFVIFFYFNITFIFILFFLLPYVSPNYHYLSFLRSSCYYFSICFSSILFLFLVLFPRFYAKGSIFSKLPFSVLSFFRYQPNPNHLHPHHPSTSRGRNINYWKTNHPYLKKDIFYFSFSLTLFLCPPFSHRRLSAHPAPSLSSLCTPGSLIVVSLYTRFQNPRCISVHPAPSSSSICPSRTVVVVVPLSTSLVVIVSLFTLTPHRYHRLFRALPCHRSFSPWLPRHRCRLSLPSVPNLLYKKVKRTRIYI